MIKKSCFAAIFLFAAAGAFADTDTPPTAVEATPEEVAPPAEAKPAKAAAPPEEAKPVEAPAPKFGSLAIISTPAGAAVLLDGKPAGNTPLVAEQLTPGEHIIQVSKEGSIGHTQAITVTAGARADVAVTLKPKEEEDKAPPQIIHTVGQKPREGRSYTVRTSARDNKGVKEVFLHFRAKQAGGDYVKSPMFKLAEGLYEGVVPSNFVKGSTLQYYLGAVDAAGNIGLDGTPESPYEMAIQALDKEPPSIMHEPAKNISDASELVISAKVLDNSGTATAQFAYRKAGEKNFVKEVRPATANGAASLNIPAAMMGGNAVEYYIEAWDEAENRATAGSAEKPLSIEILKVKPYAEGMVIERKEGAKEAVINIGSLDGLKKGDVLNVIRADEKIVDQATGQIRHIKQVAVGKIKVTALTPKTATVEVTAEIAPEKIVANQPTQLVRLRCGPVGGITATSTKIRAVDLAWMPAKEPEAAGYIIYRGETREGKYAIIATLKGAETAAYADTDSKASPINDETTYYYKVAAVNAEKVEGLPSEPAAATTKGGPAAPAAFKAVSNEILQVTFNWTKPSDPETAGYILQKADTEDGKFTDVLSIKRGEDLQAVLKASKETPLEDGRAYYYRLLAVNKVGKAGKPSATVAATTHPKPEAPAAPRIAKEFVRSISLNWDQHPDKDVAGYLVYRQDAPGGEFKKIGETKERAATALTDKGNHLKDGAEYHYAISAYLKGGAVESPLSQAVKAATFGPPETPRDFKASAGKFREVQLTWTPIKQEDIAGYELFRDADGKKPESIKKLPGRDVAAYTDKGGVFGALKDNAAYQYRIASYNVADVPSAQSEPVTGVTKPLPAKPAGLDGTSGEVKRTSLKWNANAEKDIKEYLVYRSMNADKGFSPAGSAKETSFTAGKLEDGATYYFRVTAKDTDGLESEPSDTVNVATKPLPAAPGAPAATAEQTVAGLSWNPSPTGDVVKYNIYKKGFLGGSIAGTVTDTSFTVKDLKADSSYTFYVTAVDSTGLESKPSAAVDVKTPK
ncbi:MAG: fibronectin type III domain-containing protein [Nitrospinae bacterium]|nr:fibronectin type III domain-containing protein [Nitrospinota bacterium]